MQVFKRGERSHTVLLSGLHLGTASPWREAWHTLGRLRDCNNPTDCRSGISHVRAAH